MKRISGVIFLFLLSVALWGASFVDRDMDGVDDRYDICPFTPFDEPVDRNGCAYSRAIPGSFTLFAALSGANDNESESTRYIDVWFQYRYAMWEFSLSSVAYAADTFARSEETPEYYLNLAYRFEKDETLTYRVFFGGVFSQEGRGDPYVGFDLFYSYDAASYFGAYLSHTFVPDTPIFDMLSLTYGRSLSQHTSFELALSRAYVLSTPSRYADTLRLRYIRNIDKRSDVILSYAYGLNDEAYDHVISLGIGVRF